MLVSHLAFFAASLVSQVTAATNGMRRLPAVTLQASGANGEVLLEVDGTATRVALQQEEYFFMGEATNPTNPLVQVTGAANDSDTRLLSTERFADVIQHMNCFQGQVQIQFTSQKSFQAAQTSWNWVNQSPSHRIILVTGGDSCATTPGSGQSTTGANQDESYSVSNIIFSPSSLSATLAGNIAPLGLLLDGHWKLRGSSSGIAPKSLQARLSKSGNVDLSEQIQIPNLFNEKVAGDFNVSLDAELSSQGTLNWDVEVDGLSADDLKLSITTTGVAFTLTPQLTLSGSVEAIPPVSLDLPEIPLGSPDGPFDSKIGLFLIVGAQASLGDVSAAIDASVDIELALSDGSISLNGGSSPTISGFTPSFSVNNPEVSGQVDLTSSLGPTIALVLQASMFDKGIEGGIQLNAPEAQMTLDAQASSAGVCGTDYSTGVEIDIGVGAALDAIYAYGNLKDASTSSISIFSTSTPIYSTCTGFGATVGTGSSTTSATTSPATSSTTSPITSPTSNTNTSLPIPSTTYTNSSLTLSSTTPLITPSTTYTNTSLTISSTAFVNSTSLTISPTTWSGPSQTSSLASYRNTTSSTTMLTAVQRRINSIDGLPLPIPYSSVRH